MPQTTGGYTWDKIVTGSGVTGYVARGSANENYIEVVNTGNSGETTNSGGGEKSTGNNNFKIDEKLKQVITEPATKFKDIKEKNPKAVVKKDGKSIGEAENVGTGYTLELDGKTYTIVKMGDCNGDGEVKATDYMKIKNLIMGKSSMTEAQKKAADVNGDGEIKATDYMKIKNKIMGLSKIEI